MKRFWTNRECILATSLVWIILIILIGGYYSDFLFKLKGIYSIATSSPLPVQNVLEPLDKPFAAVLTSMYKREPQKGIDGSMYNLKEEVKISPTEGMYLYELCRQVKPNQTLEIGFAYGFSTLYFLAALKANGKGSHVAIDPFEIIDWHGIGLKKVSELGMTKSFRFIPQKSEFALPALAQQGLKYEVIFIDGSHRFENVLLDFTLSDYLCSEGGFIIFHDAFYWRAVKKAVEFVELNRTDYKRHKFPLFNIAVFQKMTEDRRKSGHFVNF